MAFGKSQKMTMFNNIDEPHQIKIIITDKNPWFIGEDIATALGYDNADEAIRIYIKSKDMHKEIIAIHAQHGYMITNATAISEAGIYSLILHSGLTAADKYVAMSKIDNVAVRTRGTMSMPEFLRKQANKLRKQSALAVE